MALDAKKTEWLNRVSGSSLAIPVASGDESGSESGEKRDSDETDLYEGFLASALLAKNEEEDYAAEQLKALAIDDANRTIDPVKEKLRIANGISLKTNQGVFDFLKNNTEEVGDIRDVGGDSILGREDLGESGFDPVKHGKELKALQKKAEKELKEKETLRLKELRANQEKLNQITERINRDAVAAENLIATVKKTMESKTRPRSILDWEASKQRCLNAMQNKTAPDSSCVVFISAEQPLFSVKELIDELFTPLVNEKVLGESFVADKFSRTQIMLDATNELYKKELTDAKDPSNGLAAFTNAMIDIGTNLASGIMSATGVDSDLAVGLLRGCTELTKLVVTTADELPDSVPSETITKLLKNLPAIIGPMIGAAIGNQDIGKLIGKAGTTATEGFEVLVQSAVSGKAPSATQWAGLLNGILDVGMLNTGDEKGVALAKNLSAAVIDLAGKYAEGLYLAIKNGDKKQLRSLSLSISLDIATQAMNLSGDVNEALGGPDGSGGDAITEGGEKIGELLSEVGTQLEERRELRGQIAENNEAAKARREKLDQLRAQAEKDFSALEDQLVKEAPDYANVRESIEKQLKEEADAFDRELKGMNDPTIDDRALEKLMIQIQRDAAIMKVALAIAQGGLSVAANFIAPLAIGTEAVKMAANIKAAVERAQALRKFLDKSVDAGNATSPYFTSILNFADNQQNQLTHYSIAAALNGAKIVAAAVATGFPLAAPAVTAVGAAQAGEEALYAFHTQQQCAKAWAVTKAALNDPTNRRLGLKARRLNPTLAKYSIAYGATEEKDPVAILVANACGIDNNALKSRDANVANVVKYMELKFSDDSKVVGAYSDPVAWVDKAPAAALDTKTIYRTYQVIEGAEALQVKIKQSGTSLVPPGALIGYLKAFEEADALPEPASFDPKTVTPSILTPEMVSSVQEQVLLVGRLAALLREEAYRLNEIDGTVLDVMLEFTELAAAEQERLTTVFMKLKVLEVTAQHNADKAKKSGKI